MAHAQTPTLQHDKLQLGAHAMRIGVPAFFIGIIALAVAFYEGFTSDSEAFRSHFFHSYLAAYAFFLAITLGALIFVLIQHASRAGWSITVRRIAEGISLNVFLMVILIFPFFLKAGGESGIYYLFHWFHDGVVAGDEILTSKAGYLNPNFFFIRLVAYFIIWCFLAWFFSSRSRRQDRSGDVKISKTLDWFSAPAIILFGFSLTGFAFDWIMGLNAHWFSTIFGVYFFAGAFLSALSLIVLLSLTFQQRGLVKHAINHEHYHDLGKLMFAFTFFWGYIAFAQYMLIWYSNLPEETQFFIPRQIGIWSSLSLVLLTVHLLIPFPGLLSRHVKRKNSVIAFWAIWSLCACAFDIYWLVIPNEWTNRIAEEVGNPRMPLQNSLPLLLNSNHDIYHLKPEHAAFMEQIMYSLHANTILMTALCFIGVGGLYIFSTMLCLRGAPLVPTHDPRLTESLAFENI